MWADEPDVVTNLAATPDFLFIVRPSSAQYAVVITVRNQSRREDPIQIAPRLSI